MARFGRSQPEGVRFLRSRFVNLPSQTVNVAAPVLRIGVPAVAQINRTVPAAAPAFRLQQAAGMQVNRTVPAATPVVRITVLPASVSGAQTVNAIAPAFRIIVLAPTTQGGAQPVQPKSVTDATERIENMWTDHIQSAEWGAPVFTGRGFPQNKPEPKYITGRARATLRITWPQAKAWAVVEKPEEEAPAPVAAPRAPTATPTPRRFVVARGSATLPIAPVAKASGQVERCEDELLALVGLLDDEELWP